MHLLRALTDTGTGHVGYVVRAWLIALALLRLPVASDWPRVVALAALAALAHGFGGSAWQVAAAYWPFVVYAMALYAWRARSLGDAYLVAAAVHMLYNGAIFAAGTLARALATA